MLIHSDITKKVIGAAFEVYNHLGYGFLERVYQQSMSVEWRIRGLQCETEYPIPVQYKSESVGNYSADLFVERVVIVELKVAKVYNPKDEAQLLNELKATGIQVGLLINFGEDKVQFKRMVK